MALSIDGKIFQYVDPIEALPALGIPPEMTRVGLMARCAIPSPLPALPTPCYTANVAEQASSNAIVLAAGLSRRMGRFKLTMPWDSGTVISQVVTTLERAGVGAIIVVIGHRASEVISALDGTRARTVFNPSYANGEMFGSLQTGLRALLQGRSAPGHADGLGDEHEPGIRSDLQPPPLLLCLGDQPQMQVATVRTVLAAGEANGRQRIIIPSFEGRAGHPILLPAWIWSEILASTGTLRDVLSVHRGHTHYLPVDTPTVLADLDTPEDYARED